MSMNTIDLLFFSVSLWSGFVVSHQLKSYKTCACGFSKFIQMNNCYGWMNELAINIKHRSCLICHEMKVSWEIKTNENEKCKCLFVSKWPSFIIFLNLAGCNWFFSFFRYYNISNDNDDYDDDDDDD